MTNDECQQAVNESRVPPSGLRPSDIYAIKQKKRRWVVAVLEAGKIGRHTPFKQAIAIAMAALIVGLDSIGFAVALAALMFSGELAPGLAMGIAAVIASSIVLSLTVGTFSQLRTNMAGAQDIGVAILAITLVSAVAGLAPDARVPTAFAIISASTLATGVLLFAVGALGAGRFVRYFPLEVLAGFMAATGCLLLMGGIAMVTHVDADFMGMLQVRRMDQLILLIPALLLAALIYLAMTYFRKPFLLLGILLCAIGLFHLWRQVAGVGMAEATANNWLPVVPDVSGIAFAFPALLAGVDWNAVILATPTIATVAAISLFAALMNISAVEFATGNDLNLDREMRIAGGANMMVSAAGGPPGYTDLASTLLLQKFGITTRGVGFCVAAVEFVGLWYAVTIAMAVPTFVAGGLILYYGFDLVKDWLVSTRKVYSKREWSVVLLIVVIAVFYS
ncbi:MAG: SulP family inorganic anion transporter [Phyllobacteriaceae bacterium]|nr:SulP family inorganic anion transporter [Phyllobacteriaceae bacterium]